MQINLFSSKFVIFLIISFSLTLSFGFIIGCGDEGDSPTEMVTVDEDTTDPVEPVEPTDTPETTDPPVVVEEPKVSYNEDIHPILAESCALAGCHVAGGAGGLDLTEYDTFKVGGNRGPAFDVGNADDSLVVKYIKGEMLPQMPIGGAPLNGEQIQLIVDWINEGAENN
ncbi:hypothetical protein JT359_17555 [Candidatus Poribacteria bacterium]|nr:hypothetical protein [Candidatus Poribacteria bacterium]